MSRHGDCFEIQAALKRKFDDLPVITGPEQFVGEMRRRALVVTTTRPEGTGDAVIVDVPARGLSLIFVSRARCRTVSGMRNEGRP